MDTQNEASGNGVTVAYSDTLREERFDSSLPLQLIFGLPGKVAMNFRRKNLKGFLMPGRCNYNIGATIGGELFGVLGFCTDFTGLMILNGTDCDLFLKADIVDNNHKILFGLLIYLLKTKEVKEQLERKFCRYINKVMVRTFSPHLINNRYRKHGNVIRKTKEGNIYKIDYEIAIGTIPTIKSAKALFIDNITRRANVKKD